MMTGMVFPRRPPSRNYRHRHARGGFDFDAGHHQQSNVTNKPDREHGEADQQDALFDVIKLNKPHPPMRQRKQRGARPLKQPFEPILDDPAYLAHPFYVFTRIRAFPNGGYRHPKVAQELARQGVSPGAYDICLDAARHGFNGLRIEMKIGTNDLTDYQREERRWLMQENFAVHTAWNFFEALRIIVWYCGFDPAKVRGYPAEQFEPAAPDHGGHDARCGCDLKLSKIFK